MSLYLIIGTLFRHFNKMVGMSFSFPESEALCTGRLKFYPNSSGGEDLAQILICDSPIFNPEKLERRSTKTKFKPEREKRSSEERQAELASFLRSSCSDFAEFTRQNLSGVEDEKLKLLKLLELVKLEKQLELSDEEIVAQYFSEVPKEMRKKSDEEIAAENFERSSRRAKAKLYDIVMCTKGFSHFVTLTISPDAADRTDYKAIIHKMNNWLDNKVRRSGLVYALVPEFHSDGKSIHFHGFFNEVLELVDSTRRTKDGKIIYNIPSFKLGFTTAIEITGERIAACRYILKYVGKSGAKVGARFYLSGGALGRPRYEYFNAKLDELEGGKTFTPEGSGRTFKCKKLL